MKTIYTKSLAAFVAVAGLTLPLSTALAQDTSSGIQVASTATTSTAQPAPAPQLAYGVGQILELSQAKVGDEVIISYIKNSGNSYGLNADQIIYLRQQGISTPVLNAMLSQPTPGVYNSTASVPMPSTPAPPVQYSYAQPPPQTVTPAVTGIDPTAAAAAAGYYQPYPYYYPSYYGYSYPYYYGYPVGISVGWGWRGGWGGGWHGGGWHGGGFSGGFHGGGFGGGGVFHGGGFGGGFHGGHR